MLSFHMIKMFIFNSEATFGLLKLVALAFVVIHLGFPYRRQVWVNIHLI